MALRNTVLAACAMAGAEATGVTMAVSMSSHARGNPIRKVVTMLQKIQKKVENEGKAAEDLFDKFMCECNQQQSALTKAIEAGESKGSDVAAAVEAGAKQAEQLKQDLTQAKADRAAAKEAIAAATAIRQKEAKAFAASKGESTANIESMGKAISAIEAGSGSSFLQTNAAKKLIEIVSQSTFFQQDSDREDVTAFLSGEETSEGTGEIVGMLKQMKETMSKDLSDAEAAEADAVKTFNSLVQAKTKEFESLQASIEEKMTRLGELGVANAEAANDGGDTGDQLAEDKKLLADSQAACDKRAKEWEEEKNTRAEEVLALADTIKMLNSDEALELFKKAIPSAASSFMQVAVSTKALAARAMAGLKEAQKNSKQTMLKVEFITMALHGKKVGFEKVIALIDKFINNLKTEQTEDDDKKAYCEAELDKADDEKKAVERKVSDAVTAIKDAEESVATLKEEIKATKDSIVQLDNDVAIATMQRQQENAAYKQLNEENTAATQLIKMAKKRLNKFYNPSLALLQKGAAAESGGVIAMMDTLVRDLEKEIQVAGTEEKNAQEDYEKTMEDSKETRTASAKLLEDKKAAKAEADDSVQANVDAKKEADLELQANGQYIMTLHADCDWLLKYYDTRKQARADEIDALGKAKDVLNGADYSLLQVAHSHSVRRGLRGQSHL
jgi:hypothetical protein